MLASASQDQTVRLWDLERRQPLGEPLRRHANDVVSVAFTPDGRTLASASLDWTVRLWNLDPESWISSICTRLSRNLSISEWRQYIGEDVPYRRTCLSLPSGDGAP